MEGSERAGRIISYLHKNKFLSVKEKLALLRRIPHRKIVGRLLALAFNDQIIRFDMSELTEKQTCELQDADERLALFIRLNEDFFSDKIDFQSAKKRAKKLFKKIHIREFQFYSDLVTGGTCYLDYLTYQKVFLKKKENFIKFMRPRDANSDYAWGGKKYIFQPNYQGQQMRIYLQRGREPQLVGRNQIHYEDRLKKTLQLVKAWFKENSKHDKMQFDCILCRKDKTDRPPLSWTAKEVTLFVYDCPEKNLPLSKRLKKVIDLCNYFKTNSNKKIQMIPTEVVTGSVLSKAARHYSMAHNLYQYRNGIIIKEVNSLYTYTRSADWLCLSNFNDKESGISKGRATLVGFHPTRDVIVCKTNNGIEIEVLVSNSIREGLAKYFGYTIEYSIKDENFFFNRTLFNNGREV